MSKLLPSDVLRRDGWCIGRLTDDDGSHCALGAIMTSIVEGSAESWGFYCPGKKETEALNKFGLKMIEILKLDTDRLWDPLDAIARWNNHDADFEGVLDALIRTEKALGWSNDEEIGRQPEVCADMRLVSDPVQDHTADADRLPASGGGSEGRRLVGAHQG